VVAISLDGNYFTNTLITFMETMVEDFVRQPMTGIDFLILIGLLSIVIYCFRYIRSKK